MLQIELPHVNILSKMDLIQQYGKLAFNLDFYTDVLDLSYLCETLDSDIILKKYKRLNEKICDVVSDYSLLSFVPLNIQLRSNIIRCIQCVDRANGYIYGSLDDTEMMNSIAADIEAENEAENTFLRDFSNEQNI